MQSGRRVVLCRGGLFSSTFTFHLTAGVSSPAPLDHWSDCFSDFPPALTDMVWIIRIVFKYFYIGPCDEVLCDLALYKKQIFKKLFIYLFESRILLAEQTFFLLQIRFRSCLPVQMMFQLIYKRFLNVESDILLIFNSSFSPGVASACFNHAIES